MPNVFTYPSLQFLLEIPGFYIVGMDPVMNSLLGIHSKPDVAFLILRSKQLLESVYTDFEDICLYGPSVP